MVDFLKIILMALLALPVLASAQDAPLKPDDHSQLILVEGAPGEEIYETVFSESVEKIAAAAGDGGVEVIRIGSGGEAEGEATDKAHLQEAVQSVDPDYLSPLWIIMIGHGTYDGRDAKFNLRGPDVSSNEMVEWLGRFERRPVIVVNAASSSAPFLVHLSSPNRVVVTATKSGYEFNYTRFNRFFADVLGEQEGDIDKDGQVSLLEAFLIASRRTTAFYEDEGRVVTEFALIDDNGDQKGTMEHFFEGVRLTKEAQGDSRPDGYRAHQFALVPSEQERMLSPLQKTRRDMLELQVHRLRDNQNRLSEKEYFKQLEALLLQIAQIYEEAEGAKD